MSVIEVQEEWLAACEEAMEQASGSD